MILGAGFDPREYIQDVQYRNFLNENFQSLSPHWGITSIPQPPLNAYPESRLGLALAKSSGKDVFGHYLISRHQPPNWLVKQASLAKGSSAFLEYLVAKKIKDYKSVVKNWLVINEMFYPGGIVPCFWTKLCGSKQFIERAFSFAHKCQPEAELWLSEFGVGQNTKLWDKLYETVRDALGAGTPIHGISAHLHTNLYPTRGRFEICGMPSKLYPYHLIKQSRLAKEIRRFKDLGLKFHLSELTVWPRRDEPNRIVSQGRVYKKYVRLGIYEGCDRISFWSPLDDIEKPHISWHWQNKTDYPGLFYKEAGVIKPKPFTEELLGLIK